MQSVSQLHTFAINSNAELVLPITSESQLIDYFKTRDTSVPYWILGHGSNCVFTNDFFGHVLKIELLGVEITETDDDFYINVKAGENWHQLVSRLTDENIWGLENLALIPGTVGAAPIQNIGAYGVEICQFIDWVEYVDAKTCERMRLSNKKCQFSYRDSVFKRVEMQGHIVTSVRLKLPKNWRPVRTYGELTNLPESCSGKDIFNTVIAIRQSKIPDPAETPNAGSFFKNPIIEKTLHRQLKEKYPTMPSYNVDEHYVKIAAGWLIEHAGLKGETFGRMAVHAKQALVLVNTGSVSGDDVKIGVQKIRTKVFELFGILLEPEVRLIENNGELNLPVPATISN